MGRLGQYGCLTMGVVTAAVLAVCAVLSGCGGNVDTYWRSRSFTPVRRSSGFAGVRELSSGVIVATCGASLRGYSATLEPRWNFELIEPPMVPWDQSGATLFAFGRPGTNGDLFNEAPPCLLAIGQDGALKWRKELEPDGDTMGCVNRYAFLPDGSALLSQSRLEFIGKPDTLCLVGPDGKDAWTREDVFPGNMYSLGQTAVADGLALIAWTVTSISVEPQEISQVTAVSLATGETLWRYTSVSSPQPDPAAHGNEVVFWTFSTAGQKDVGLDKSGRVVEVKNYPDPDSWPSIQQYAQRDPLGRLWTWSTQHITRWDEQGNPAWQILSDSEYASVPSFAGFFSDGGILTEGDGFGMSNGVRLRRHDPDGNEMWSSALSGGWMHEMILSSGGVCVAISNDAGDGGSTGSLVLLDEQGQETARIASDGYYWENPNYGSAD